MEMEVWDSPVEEWREYILSKWRGDGRVEELTDSDPTLDAIRERATRAFVARGIRCKRLRTWANVMLPTTGVGYDAGYPHVHQNTRATTLVHYLDPGDVPCPLHIFDGDAVIESIEPQVGQTVYMPNGVKHGVLKNTGTRPRVAVIATAY